MTPELRELFDAHLGCVVRELPAQVRSLMNEVPLMVEDYPSNHVMRATGIRHRGELCGLYTGIPITEQSVEQWGVPSPIVTLFRQGILDQARTASGAIDPAELREQMRITILHEYGHHHGLDEDELRGLGYG